VLIAGNWKMFKTRAEAAPFFAAFEPPDGVEVVVCPPYPSLADAVASGLTTYAQNVHWSPEGAFTGEVSAPMLLDLGVQGALVGHSERRQYFGETDETVARRASAALAAGLNVIACIGESEEERDSGQTELVLRLQVESVRDAVGPHERLVVAYEPVWAIGTGKNATPDDAAQVHELIRFALSRRGVKDRIPILYGGSVNTGNVLSLLERPELDGVLVGGASLDPDAWAELVGLGG
jgi:triosephosphate isomerase (TIM)